MNSLVEYLLKHHNPGGNAIQHVRIDDFLDETEWTRKEILDIALEAKDNRRVTRARTLRFIIEFHHKL